MKGQSNVIFRTVVLHLTRFQVTLRRRAVLCDSWATCYYYVPENSRSMAIIDIKLC